MTFTEQVAAACKCSPLDVLEFYQGRITQHGDEPTAMVETRAHFAQLGAPGTSPSRRARPRGGRLL